VAGSQKFSSDHTIAQYAIEIWQAEAVSSGMLGSAHLASCREPVPETPPLASRGLSVTQTATLA
jgi:hypothetical protein